MLSLRLQRFSIITPWWKSIAKYIFLGERVNWNLLAALVAFVIVATSVQAQNAVPTKTPEDSLVVARWLHHALPNGDIPYASCFGAAAACKENCSIIKIVNGGSDVVVLIKNTSGVVIQHGYVVRDSTWAFPVQDGVYQVFFYTGTGWNPDIPVRGATCKELRGAFVRDASISKADVITLESQMMTYELILLEHGNLELIPCTPGEAF